MGPSKRAGAVHEERSHDDNTFQLSKPEGATRTRRQTQMGKFDVCIPSNDAPHHIEPQPTATFAVLSAHELPCILHCHAARPMCMQATATGCSTEHQPYGSNSDGSIATTCTDGTGLVCMEPPIHVPGSKRTWVGESVVPPTDGEPRGFWCLLLYR